MESLCVCVCVCVCVCGSATFLTQYVFKISCDNRDLVHYFQVSCAVLNIVWLNHILFVQLLHLEHLYFSDRFCYYKHVSMSTLILLFCFKECIQKWNCWIVGHA